MLLATDDNFLALDGYLACDLLLLLVLVDVDLIEDEMKGEDGDDEEARVEKEWVDPVNGDGDDVTLECIGEVAEVRVRVDDADEVTEVVVALFNDNGEEDTKSFAFAFCEMYLLSIVDTMAPVISRMKKEDMGRDGFCVNG